jgi:MFS transporter, DHA2 family, multidrug resistance protein
MHTAEHEPDLRATPKEWWGLAVLALPILVIGVNMTVLFLGLPELAADLGTTAVQTLWIADIYALMLAGFLITMGGVGDRIGRRRTLLLGAAALGITAAAAALAPGPAVLIVLRGLMGLFAASLMPATLGLIRELFRDARQRTTAIAVWMTCMSVGMAVGPLVGGFLLEHFGWQSLFLAPLPLLAGLLLAGPFLLPEARTARPGRIDAASVVLSLAAMISMVYALKEFAQYGIAPVPVAAATLGLTAAVLFVRRQRRLPHPLVDLQLVRHRSVGFSLAMITGAALAFAGVQLLLATYLQQVAELSAWRAGVWMMPSAVALLVGSLLAPVVVHRIGFRPLLSGALALGAVGFASLIPAGLLHSAGAHSLSFALVQAGVAVAFLAAAFPFVLGPDLVLSSAPPHKAAEAGALEETSAELGVALGLALLGSTAAAVYRGLMGGVVIEAPDEAAAAARDGIDGAIAHAPSLDAATVGAAREAFTTGLATAGAVGAVLMAALAMAAVRFLRHVPGETGQEPTRTPQQ